MAGLKSKPKHHAVYGEGSDLWFNNKDETE
jgi:hypothetical protein